VLYVDYFDYSEFPDNLTICFIQKLKKQLLCEVNVIIRVDL